LEDTNSVRVMMVTGKWVKERAVVVVEEEEEVADTVTVGVVVEVDTVEEEEEELGVVEEVAGELKNSIILMDGPKNRKSKKDGVGEDIKF